MVKLSSSSEVTATHTRLGNDFRNWMHTAQALFASSTILTRERERATSDLRPGPAPIEVLTLWPEIMLAAFGIECLIKALWLRQGHILARAGKYVPILRKEAHDLARLCAAVGVALTPAETDALERMSIISRSIGRYPISRTAHETRPRRFVTGAGSPFFWSDGDDRLVESLVMRLKKQLRQGTSARQLSNQAMQRTLTRRTPQVSND